MTCSIHGKNSAGDFMRDRHFREDENELPFLVSSRRDDYRSGSSYGGTNFSKLYETANRLIDDDELDEALTLINILIDRNPDDDRYWNLKGIVYSKKGDINGIFGDRYYEESLKCFNIAIKLNPGDYILKKNKAFLLIDFANVLRIQNEYVSAIHKMDEALSLLDENKTDNHTLAHAWNVKALCYHAVGSYDAFECYDKALEYEPDNEVIKANKDALRHYDGIDNEFFYG